MANENVIELTEANFDQEITNDTSGLPTLVDFWAPWCGPCKMIAPVIDEIANEKKGTARVAKLNVDHAQSIAARYGISAIPALIVFKEGKPVQQIVGLQGKAAIIAKIDAAA